MKYLKKYKGFTRPIFIGTKVVWLGRDAEPVFKNAYAAPHSRNVKNGDLCEITKRKNIKGELYVKAKNLRNNKPINLLFNSSGNRMQYSRDGSWLEFDKFFELELDQDTKKYNL